MRHWAVAVGLLALAACSKKEPPSAEAPPSAASVTEPAPVASAPTPEPSASTAAGPEIPIEEDFEDEANLKVNAQTLDAQLDALEKEIKAN